MQENAIQTMLNTIGVIVEILDKLIDRVKIIEDRLGYTKEDTKKEVLQ